MDNNETPLELSDEEIQAELNKMFKETVSNDSILEDAVKQSIKENEKKMSEFDIRKSELEVALRSLTPAEREYALLHDIKYRSTLEVEHLKREYKEAYRFGFGARLKAAWNLIFKNKITTELSVHIIHEMSSKELNSEIGKNEHVAGIDIDSRPLSLASTEQSTLAEKLEEAGVRLNPRQKDLIAKWETPKDNGSNADRIERELDFSITALIPPTIVETTTMTTTKQPAKRTAKKAVVKRSTPKKTK